MSEIVSIKKEYLVLWIAGLLILGGIIGGVIINEITKIPEEVKIRANEFCNSNNKGDAIKICEIRLIEMEKSKYYVYCDIHKSEKLPKDCKELIDVERGIKKEPEIEPDIILLE